MVYFRSNEPILKEDDEPPPLESGEEESRKLVLELRLMDFPLALVSPPESSDPLPEIALYSPKGEDYHSPEEINLGSSPQGEGASYQSVLDDYLIGKIASNPLYQVTEDDDDSTKVYKAFLAALAQGSLTDSPFTNPSPYLSLFN